MGPFHRPVSIREAKILIRSGEPVGLPTETVYGLAASVFHQTSIKKIFEIKGRPWFDPLIVHVSDKLMAKALTSDWPPIADFLCDHFWPGPLTLVLPKRSWIGPIVTSGQDTVALRCPNHPIFQAVLKDLGPVAAPSANRFGKTSPTRWSHVYEEYGGEVPCVDGGECSLGIESTILCVDGKTLSLLRPGLISREELDSFLKNRGFCPSWEEPSEIFAPGSLKKHYQPPVPLIILLNAPQDLETSRISEIIKDLPVEKSSEVQLKPPWVKLNLPEEPFLCARYLYHELRTQSKPAGTLFLFWDQKKTEGDWLPIWDRLKKASSFVYHY